jgi:hypothetical protein
MLLLLRNALLSLMMAPLVLAVMQLLPHLHVPVLPLPLPQKSCS